MSRTGDLRAVLVCGWFATVGSSVRAESPVSLDRLSPLERQQADFYGAIAGMGPAIAVEWRVEPNRIELGGEVELTLIVRNAANPAELQRPNLTDKPEWKALFGAIQEVPAAAAEFRWRLKPRNDGEFELPVPKYRYFNPRLPEGRRFQVAFAEAPKLSVRPPAVVEVPQARVPLDAPPRFFEEVPQAADQSAAPPASDWWALRAFGTLIPPGWIALWRWRNPDAVRLARIRRAKSVRAALDGLREAERSPDPGASVSGIVLAYLRDRWRLPYSARTPREAAHALGAAEFPPERIRDIESLLARCDEARFGGGGDTGPSLVEATRNLIARWEGAAP